MVIYLSHPIHGTKVAISEAEAAADEKNGWKRKQIPALFKPVNNLIVPENNPVMPADDEIRAQWAKKYGKKPHHKKTIETLQKELA